MRERSECVSALAPASSARQPVIRLGRRQPVLALVGFRHVQPRKTPPVPVIRTRIPWRFLPLDGRPRAGPAGVQFVGERYKQADRSDQKPEQLYNIRPSIPISLCHCHTSSYAL